MRAMSVYSTQAICFRTSGGEVRAVQGVEDAAEHAAEHLELFGRGVLDEQAMHARDVGVGGSLQGRSASIGHDGRDAASVLGALTARDVADAYEARDGVGDA